MTSPPHDGGGEHAGLQTVAHVEGAAHEAAAGHAVLRFEARRARQERTPTETQLLAELCFLGMVALLFLGCVTLSRRWTIKPKGAARVTEHLHGQTPPPQQKRADGSV